MTVQTPDKMIADGTTLPVIGTYLPLSHPDLDTSRLHGSALALSSDCVRGYFATWELRNRQLFLVSVDGNYRLKTEHPIPAEWLTGTLIVGEGHPRPGDHHPWHDRSFEKELRIRLETGLVVEIWRWDDSGRTLLAVY